MVLQQLIELGHMKVTDCLVDDNNIVLEVGDHHDYIIDF